MKRAAIVVVLLLLIVVLSGAGMYTYLRLQNKPPSNDGLPSGLVTLDQVRSHEEAHLFYPGVQEFSQIGSGEEHNVTADLSAFAGAIVGSADPPDKIYPWYERWLLGHGWTRQDVGDISTWKSSQGYARGSRERFVVAVDDPQALANSLGRRVPAGGTLFEIRYSILPAH